MHLPSEAQSFIDKSQLLPSEICNTPNSCSLYSCDLQFFSFFKLPLLLTTLHCTSIIRRNCPLLFSSALLLMRARCLYCLRLPRGDPGVNTRRNQLRCHSFSSCGVQQGRNIVQGTRHEVGFTNSDQIRRPQPSRRPCGSSSITSSSTISNERTKQLVLWKFFSSHRDSHSRRAPQVHDECTSAITNNV